MTTNIQPTKFLANGASGYMHSLTLRAVHADFEEPLKEPGFKLITLNSPPKAINFQLTLPEDDDGKGIESLVDGAIVVPLVESRNVVECETHSLLACMKACPKTLRTTGFPVDLAFADTDYKLQGENCGELVFSAAPHPLSAAYGHEGSLRRCEQRP